MLGEGVSGLPSRGDLLELLQDPIFLAYRDAQGRYRVISPVEQSWWNHNSEVSENIEISKGEFGNPVIFVWGERGSFSDIPTSESLYVDTYAVNGSDGIDRIVSGLRISLDNTAIGWTRAVLIIDEVDRVIHNNPAVGLSTVVALILELVGTIIPRGGLLTRSEMKGLYGEMVLFSELLDIADRERISHQAVLDAWKGYMTPARRDFSKLAVQTKIEVKTTGKDDRHHEIGNYRQLIEAEGEHLFLFSVSAKFDASGSDSLNAIISRVSGRLSPGHRNSLNSYLSQYGNHGYHQFHARHYDEPILVDQFESELFDLRQVDYFQGFGENHAPAASTGYSYTLLLDASVPLETVDRESALLSIIN